MSGANARSGARLVPALAAAGLAGVSVTAVGLARRPAEAWPALLAAGLFGVSIALGAGTVMATGGASSATWWLPIRRAPAAIAAALPVPAVALGLALTLGMKSIYPWAAPGRPSDGWLTGPFFLARAIVILGVWFFALARLGAAVLGAPGREGARARNVASVVFLVLLGPTISIAWFDWVMSIEPPWASTAYGVYGFAASFQAGLAAVVVGALVLVPAEARPPSLLHDLGKLLFAFSIFWAYIWFCQYLLIWYADLPEEVGHFTRRLEGGAYGGLFWAPPLLCFVAPFLLLLSARAKRSPGVLGAVAGVVLVGQWLDAVVEVGAATLAPIDALGAATAVAAGMALVAGRAAAPQKGSGAA